MKKRFFFFIFFVGFMISCSKETPVGSIDDEHEIIMPYCILQGYSIEYVDGIDTFRCYAFRNVNEEVSWEVHNIQQTIQEYGINGIPRGSESQYYYEKYHKRCMDIRTDGMLYCLRNMTQCLKLEDNDRICVVMDLPKEMWK